MLVDGTRCPSSSIAAERRDRQSTWWLQRRGSAYAHLLSGVPGGGDPLVWRRLAREGDHSVSDGLRAEWGRRPGLPRLRPRRRSSRPALLRQKIKLVSNDSRLCPDTGIAGGSRSHWTVGRAIHEAAGKLMDAMRKPDGTYRTYEEMMAEGIPTRYQGASIVPRQCQHPDANTGEGEAFPETMYVLWMSEVEVETATGQTKVLALKAASDVGAIGNLQGVEGQAYGGMSHSLGFALKTDFRDMKKHSTMKGSGITEIDDMPDDIELLWQETPRVHQPHGSCGASECFQSALHVAILNAHQQRGRREDNRTAGLS